MQPDESEEREVPLDRVVVERRVRERPLGDSEDLQSSRGPVLGHSFDRRCFVGVQCRALENDLECSFHVHTRSADVLVHEGHALAQRIEGQLAHETPSLEQHRAREATLVRRERERDVDRIACPPHFSVLIQQASGRSQRRCGEKLSLVSSARGRRAGQAKPILGERARLVGGDDRRAPERLDRGQPANDRTPRGHLASAQREGDGDRRRQTLRHRGDSHGNPNEECLFE